MSQKIKQFTPTHLHLWNPPTGRAGADEVRDGAHPEREGQGRRPVHGPLERPVLGRVLRGLGPRGLSVVSGSGVIRRPAFLALRHASSCVIWRVRGACMLSNSPTTNARHKDKTITIRPRPFSPRPKTRAALLSFAETPTRVSCVSPPGQGQARHGGVLSGRRDF